MNLSRPAAALVSAAVALPLLLCAATRAAAAEPSAVKVSAAVDAALTVTATIPVGGLPTSVATDPLTDMIYVTNLNGTVSVISGRANVVTATIPVGSIPSDAATDR
jgi:YVTN family beta-propeller protein